MLFANCFSRRLDGVVFDCGCDIRWIQLWQQRGEAVLHTQQLYCRNGASKIPLHNMYIHNCGKRRGGEEGGCALHFKKRKRNREQQRGEGERGGLEQRRAKEREKENG